MSTSAAHVAAAPLRETASGRQGTPGRRGQKHGDDIARGIERIVKRVRKQAPGQVGGCCEIGGGLPVGSAGLIRMPDDAPSKPPAPKAALREQA